MDSHEDVGYFRRERYGEGEEADRAERLDLAFANRFPDLWLKLNRAVDPRQAEPVIADLDEKVEAALAELTA